MDGISVKTEITSMMKGNRNMGDNLTVVDIANLCLMSAFPRAKPAILKLFNV